MNIFIHPRNGAILATTDTHAIYVPLSMGMSPQTQLQDADFHLTQKTSRCFVLSGDCKTGVIPPKSPTEPDPLTDAPGSTEDVEQESPK